MNAKEVRRAAEERLSLVPGFFDEALSATHTIWLDCPHCKKRSQADAPDWSVRIRAVEALVRLADKGKAKNGRRGKDGLSAPGYVADDRFKGRPPLTGGDRDKYAKAVAPKVFPPSRSAACEHGVPVTRRCKQGCD